MEVDEIQTQACKFSRIRSDSDKIGRKGEDEDKVELKRIVSGGGGNEIGRHCGWPSSRIVRVSRASGGKDRHSKVWTSRGLRDRRVRLSVTTAIQFYDLQDRLGYDQPSKAVEWLLKAAASSIAELPSLNTSFPDTPKQPSDEKRSSGGTTEIGFDSTDHLELDIDRNFRQQQQQNVSLSKSACSSTSETSKGSGGLSLSRTENRIKARERARGRAAEKEKEKETESLFAGHHQNVTSIPQNSSFTELLTGNINNANNNNSAGHKSSRQWPSTPMDYLASGLNHSSTGFSGQIHLGNSLSHSMMVSPFSVTPGYHHQELQQFSFVPENLVPVATAAGGSDYNLNFSISSGLAGNFNRGTLQSNSPSMLPHLQRFSPIDGSNSPFFLGSTAPNAENHHQHHQFPAGFDGRLQLYYGEAGRHSDQKGKGKH